MASSVEQKSNNITEGSKYSVQEEEKGSSEEAKSGEEADSVCVLTMRDVKFRSCSNLPSMLADCRIEEP
jgi:hypothetical protein